MNSRKLLVAGLICGTPLLLHAGFNIGVNFNVPVSGGVVVHEGPPPPYAEQIYPAPGPDYIWINGHWLWRGRWVWAPGHWDRMHPGAVWISGHWDHRPGGYVWVDGQWVVQSAPAPVSGEVVVQEEPPPPIVEQYGPAPGPDFFWIGGFWAWHGGWVWNRGHYARHPRWHPGGGWVAGRWINRGGGHVWIQGHWR